MIQRLIAQAQAASSRLICSAKNSVTPSIRSIDSLQSKFLSWPTKESSPIRSVISNHLARWSDHISAHSPPTLDSVIPSSSGGTTITATADAQNQGRYQDDDSGPPDRQQSGEGTPPEPLALTLSAPTICETLPAQEYAGGRVYQDEEGNWHVERTSSGWTGVNEVRVAWTASGGAAPYTLQIDGEPRDVAGAYAGANGTASVSCALRSSGVFFPHPLDEEHRRYRTGPEVDSGLKTIRATVTDGSGATAEASIAVYVILSVGSSGDILQSGETYRVLGTLLTVPEGVDHLILGGMVGE